MLLRRSHFSSQEWVDFLQHIRKELNPHLDKFTLPKLGDLGCVHSEEGDTLYHKIYDDKPEFEIGLPLSTHAISYFEDSGRCSRVDHLTRTQVAWVLTKASEWAIMEVDIRLGLSEQAGMTREKAFRTRINVVTLEEMLEKANVYPFRVWQSIRRQVDAWESRQKVLYENVSKVARGFEGLDLALTQMVLLKPIE